MSLSGIRGNLNTPLFATLPYATLASEMLTPHSVLLSLAALTVGVVFAQKEVTMPTEKGNVTLLLQDIVPGNYGDVTLKGAVRNDTPFKINFLQFEMVAYNSSNVDVKLCGSIIGCWFHVFDTIDPGSMRTLTSPGNIINTHTLPKSMLPVRSEFRVLEMQYFIKYDVGFSPVSNDRFTITPTFTVRGIGLDFRNTSDDVIEIAWDQSVYIDEEGNSSRLIKGNVNLAEKDRPQPNTVIPPGTKLQETVFPVDHVKLVDGKWQQEPILPEIATLIDPELARQRSLDRAASHIAEPDIYRAGMKNLTGKEMRLFLRILVNDQKQNVTIPFKIADMVQ